MYTVATHLVEVKSGLPFADFLHQHFFRPLNMQSTSLQREGARAKGLQDRIATGYIWSKETSMYHGFQSPDCPEGQGAGSIITSVNDFIRWVKALVNRENPINEHVYQGLVRMRTLMNPDARRLKPFTSPAVYAAGMEVYYYRGHMVSGHNGVIPGFASRFFFLPEFKFGAVILSNSAGGGPVATILTRELIDRVLGVSDTERSRRNQGNTTTLSANVKSQTDQPKHKATRTTRKKDKVQQLRASVISHPQPQETPLDAYMGRYWNSGYHFLSVDVKDEKLFIDATDRSMGFSLTFEHVSGGTKYIAHLEDFLEGGDDLVPAKFIFEDGQAVRLGLHLEKSLKDMIWFERVAHSTRQS
ncbi:hypothetical protein EYZ11_002237 [Aspergillus tanneri]|nr:hypothetical protein EYZ11_002237 [Aspergillus tanneri]